jgi:hypothetical protein
MDYGFFENVAAIVVKTKVLGTIERALEQAAIGKEEINSVIVAGGSCELRPFVQAITHIFGKNKIIRPDKVQWSVAEGAAWLGSIGGNYRLNDDLCLLLNDRSVHPIFEKGKSGVGSSVEDIAFSLTEDAQNAHFVFCNREQNIMYAKQMVRTKGFLNERLRLSAAIGNDQIADITLSNSFMETGYHENVKINKLTFYYDLSNLYELPNSEKRVDGKTMPPVLGPKPRTDFDARDQGHII